MTDVHFTEEQKAKWAEAEHYHNNFLIPKDDALDAALQNMAESGLEYEYSVSPAQGKQLNLLARSVHATKILEVGTLGGYSTIWLARALPDGGKVVTLELVPKHAEVARQNIEKAGLAHKVEIIVGPAAETIEKLGPDGSFDFCFIDANKDSSVKYFSEAKRLVRGGGIIIADNVIQYGRVSDLENTSPRCEGVRSLLKYIQNDQEVDATTIGTVGEKGWDGFLMALRK